MLMQVTIALYFGSMAVALIYAIIWLRGQFTNKPNSKWKGLLISMAVIFISSILLSYQRNQVYKANQARLDRIARRKGRIERHDLLQMDIVEKSGYDGALVLVMQPNRHHGIMDKLNGSQLEQATVLRNAQQAMYRERKDNTAKKGGILIVSYTKVGKKFKPTMLLYASKHALKNVSQDKHLGTTKFLTDDLSAYYFNQRYVTVATKGDGILADIPLKETKHFKRSFKKQLVSGKIVFVQEPKRKHR